MGVGILKNKSKISLKNVIIVLAAPSLIYLVFLVLCGIQNIEFLKDSGNFMTFVVNVFTMACIAWGISFNLPSGRFDFSIGSVILLSTILGTNTALQLHFGAIGLAISCMSFGALLGAISGFMYVLFRLPAMITSLGVALTYESISFVFNNSQGASIMGNMDLMIFIQQPYIYILAAVILIFLYVVVNYTKFGYNSRALAGGQQIAVDIGINEKFNAILSYAICGMIVAIAGLLKISRLGTLQPVLGLSTISSMFAGFLPLFISDVLEKWCERIIGIFIGAIISGLISSGLVALNLDISMQNIINAFILLVLLSFTINKHKLLDYARNRKRKKILHQI